MSQTHKASTIILVGATGDLAKKKVLKAIYSLHEKGHLDDNFRLVGNARAAMTDVEFCDFIRDIVKPAEDLVWQAFAQKVCYIAGSIDNPETFAAIKSRIIADCANSNILWYLATLPNLYDTIIKHIGNFGLNQSPNGWVKIMLEKPFGTDYYSAKKLNEHLTSIFSEDQIYRIDHFLAKETVQNLLIFRFANSLFENIWNNNFIDNIQVNSLEDIGIEGREVFYDQTGAIRDYFQNHILQMIAATLMQQPKSLSVEHIRESRINALNSLRPLDVETIQQNTLFGQFKGYLDHPNVNPQSKTETAFALKIFSELPEFKGVPIYVRGGKKLSKFVSEITIVFKKDLTESKSWLSKSQKPSSLTLRIGPNEGVIIRMYVKKPGLQLNIDEVPMQFCYKNEYQINLVEAYVKLIYDALMGDPTLFPYAAEIEAAWKFVEPILQYKSSSAFALVPYDPGSSGPESFNKMLESDGKIWLEPASDVCMISNIVKQKQ